MSNLGSTNSSQGNNTNNTGSQNSQNNATSGASSTNIGNSTINNNSSANRANTNSQATNFNPPTPSGNFETPVNTNAQPTSNNVLNFTGGGNGGGINNNLTKNLGNNSGNGGGNIITPTNSNQKTQPQPTQFTGNNVGVNNTTQTKTPIQWRPIWEIVKVSLAALFRIFEAANNKNVSLGHQIGRLEEHHEMKRRSDQQAKFNKENFRTQGAINKEMRRYEISLEPNLLAINAANGGSLKDASTMGSVTNSSGSLIPFDRNYTEVKVLKFLDTKASSGGSSFTALSTNSSIQSSTLADSSPWVTNVHAKPADQYVARFQDSNGEYHFLTDREFTAIYNQ